MGIAINKHILWIEVKYMTNEEYVKIIKALTEQKEKLEKQVTDLQRENNRKTYIASGLVALLGKTGDKDLVHQGLIIAQEADKLY